MPYVSIGTRLQLKAGHSVALLHKPGDVALELPEVTSPSHDPATADAVIVFVTNRRELDKRADPFIKAAARDALAWVAYPKGGRLDTDLNRDSLRELLGQHHIRPVRQVAVDATWSALRFRPAQDPRSRIAHEP